MTDDHPPVESIASDDLARWLRDAPHAADPSVLLAGLATRLRAAGVPLWRARYALMTMHPEVLWRAVLWRTPGAVDVIDQPHARLDEPFYRSSPVAAVRETRRPVRVRLDPDDDIPYSIGRELRDEGGTDYLVLPLPFTSGQVSYASFATDAPGGFSDEAIALLESLALPLARRIELESAYYATRALLEVYLGRNAAGRVFGGAIRRGTGELVDAAIWFSDMRDFTALSDRTPPGEVIQVLDGYFDAVATAIDAHGGEVLKFIGDAVLALFPLEGDAESACRRALAAAEEAFAGIARLNDARQGRGEAPVAIGVALHKGAVMYGNIGARARLDFTVISSSVNEASRLESLSKTLGVSLVLSAAFTAAANVPDAVDLGEHALKGVTAKQRVFTRRA